MGRVHCHSGRPLVRSSATTEAGPDVTYITPFMTIGVFPADGGQRADTSTPAAATPRSSAKFA